MASSRLIPLGLILASAASFGEAQAQSASDVFGRYAETMAKVEVLESNSSTPSSVGTAFFAGENLLITNYHVVRDAFFEPDAYTLRVLDSDGETLPAPEILVLDPVNDLSVVRVAAEAPSWLGFSADPVPQGEVLFSMGHPRDLNAAVVEGTYNGLIEAAVSPMMLFSGSINPGMSGGPTVRADGSVVGVNVATAGNQLSFLVPADRAALLLEEATDAGSPTDDELLADATARLHAFQDDFFGGPEMATLSTVEFGNAVAPAPPEGVLNCDAIPHEITDDRYELTEYGCGAEDMMLLGPEGTYSLVYMEHMWMSAEELSSLAYHSLATSWYTTVTYWEAPMNDDATEYECRERSLEDGMAAEILVTFCARTFESHEGLYGLFVRSVLRGGGKEGVVSTLRASPISWENAISLTELWLGGLAWTN